MRLGFLGLGNMGGPMAGHLIAAGHDVAVVDLRPELVEPLVEAGGRPVGDGAEASQDAEAVFLSLPGPTEVEAVVAGPDGLLETMAPRSTIIDLSTSSPSLSRRLATEGAERQLGFLDAPVSGGVRGARRGTLAVMVGGSEEVFAAHQSLLATFAAKVVHCGDSGAGNVVKLVNNMLAFTNMMGAIEALVLGTRAGVDPEILREVVEASSGASSVWSGATRAILADRLDPTFTTSLAAKDVGLAVELAQELAVPVPVGGHVEALIRDYRDQGFADQDLLATVKVIESEAGFTVRGWPTDAD